MANCQNNMRYGRQMNFNNGCRNMPANNNNGSRTPEPCGCVKPEPCGCQRPEPRERRNTEPCGCQKPEPRKEGCMSRPQSNMEARTPECGMPKRSKPENCRCRYDALEEFPIAMAYVPWQKWQNVCDACRGLQRGTIFEDLSKPFHGKGGCNR